MRLVVVRSVLCLVMLTMVPAFAPPVTHAAAPGNVQIAPRQNSRPRIDFPPPPFPMIATRRMLSVSFLCAGERALRRPGARKGKESG